MRPLSAPFRYANPGAKGFGKAYPAVGGPGAGIGKVAQSNLQWKPNDHCARLPAKTQRPRRVRDSGKPSAAAERAAPRSEHVQAPDESGASTMRNTEGYAAD